MLGTRGDGGEHDVTGGHREVVGVVLADAEEVDPDLFGEDAFLHHVADRLSVRQRLAVGSVGAIPEGVEAEHQRERGPLASRRLSSSWTGRPCQALRL